MSWLINRRHSSSSTIEATRRTRKCSPGLTLLEGRALLSTLTVSSAGDQGPGTLRGALASSQNGVTIVFAPRMHGKTIRLTSGPLVVSTNVTIIGPGARGVTISAHGTSGDFMIEPDVQATFQSLTITGGNATQGGGIDNLGGLDLFECTLRGNQANQGGAIYNAAPASSPGSAVNSSTNTIGSLSVIDSAFVGNSAVAGPGQIASGGAIDSVNGNIAVASSKFSKNRAMGGSGGGNGLGGAIDADFSLIDISGDTLAHNEALGGSAAGDGIGGAIDIQNSPSEMLTPTQTNPNLTSPNQTTVIGDVFKQNLAVGGEGGGNGLGGAVRVANDGSMNGVFIGSCQFSGNQANGGSGSFGGYGAGGAIKLGSESGPDSTSTMTLDSDTYINNSATGGNGMQQGGAGDGGAVDLLADTNNPSPSTPASAPSTAAIVRATTSIRITLSNSSGRANGSAGGSGGGDGVGGVFHLGFGPADVEIDLEIDDSFYTNNSATGGPGKGPADGARAAGGAIMLDSGNDTLQNVFVTGNVAMGTPRTLKGGRGGGLALGNVSSFDSNAVITGNRAESPNQNMFPNPNMFVQA
jgi:hypothetical protein